MIHLRPRASIWLLALTLVAFTATLGCLFHTGVIQVASPAPSDGESRNPLSGDEVAVIAGVVEQVAMDEGFRVKRAAGTPFGAKLLAYYASDEQISMAVAVARDSRLVSIRIRDVNHTRETSYVKGLRSAIESGVRAKLPDLELSYATAR